MSKKLIDLSHHIINKMSVHPYDDDVNLIQDKYLKNDQYNNFRIETGMHAGTHMDAPMHLVENDKYISEYPLELFSGQGCLIDVRGMNEIPYKDEYEELVNAQDIVILYTGHSDQFGTKEYYNHHPVITRDFAEFLIRKKIKILGLDTPSPDQYPFEIHKLLLQEDIFIIENLTNLSKLDEIDNFEVFAFPLKVKAEASILRVVARELS